MKKLFLIRAVLFCVALLFGAPLVSFAQIVPPVAGVQIAHEVTRALGNFGGWVLNVPTAGGPAGRAAVAAAAAKGTTVIYPPCLNGLEEVNLLSPPLGIKSPPVLFQFAGAYTFSFGPAKFVGQKMLGKYLPTPVPCIATFLLKIPCPPAVCIVPTPLPLFLAPLILFNGSSLR